MIHSFAGQFRPSFVLRADEATLRRFGEDRLRLLHTARPVHAQARFAAGRVRSAGLPQRSAAQKTLG